MGSMCSRVMTSRCPGMIRAIRVLILTLVLSSFLQSAQAVWGHELYGAGDVARPQRDRASGLATGAF